MLRRTFLCATALLTLAGPALAAPKDGGNLVMLVQPEPPTLATYFVTSAPIGQVTTKVYDGLLEYDFDLKPLPSLAKSWEVAPDGKTITFKLRTGVVFHDGKPFTSEDARFSIADVLSKIHPRGISTFRNLTAVEAPDPETLVLRLDKPSPYILSALSGLESPMLPKHLMEGRDLKTLELANKPVGTGPFRFVEWKRGEYVRLEKNKSYWKPGLPHLDRIVARFVPDSSTRTALLEKGEAHIAGLGSMPYNDVKKITAVPGMTATTKGNEMVNAVVELTINTRKHPFDKQEVRQAISYAIDRKFVVDNIFFGAGRPSTGPISGNFAPTGFYTADVLDYGAPDRIARANALLDKAGLPRNAEGVRFEMIHDVLPYGEEWRRFGEATQQWLRQIGIKVTLRNEDVPTWLRRVYIDGSFEMASNHLYNFADPVTGVHRGIHSNAILPGTVFVNASGWSSPETDKLMNDAMVENDPGKRALLYRTLQQKITEAEPNIYVFDLNYPTVYNSKYHDLIASPLGVYGSFDQAWFDR